MRVRRGANSEGEARSAFVPKPKPPAFPLPLDIPPMESRTAEALPDSGGPWQFEPKWDGFRCLAFRDGADVELRAKSGKTLSRYFPEVVAALRALPPQIGRAHV